MKFINKNVIFFIGILAFVSCANSNSCIVLSDSMSAKWKADSNGCLGYRWQLFYKHEKNKLIFIGVDTNCLYRSLGYPTYVKANGRQSVSFFYLIGCKYILVPTNKDDPNIDRKRRTNFEATYLELNLNKRDGIVTSVQLMAH